LVVAFSPDACFSGWTAITATHAGTAMDGSNGNPNWDDGDRGFGLWFYEPATFYGRTADGRTIGNEAGNRYTITVRADGPSGWAECDLEIAIPDVGEITPYFSDDADIDLGAISAAPGDTLVDIASYLTGGTVAEWWVYSGDPTQLSGTPTFRMDGGLLKLHWPSTSYSGEAFSLVIGGRSADGIWAAWPRTITFSLTATAAADPGIPAGWTLPPDPEPFIPPAGTARPMIDGRARNPFIDSRLLIR
jgi:hypothetical protein